MEHMGRSTSISKPCLIVFSLKALLMLYIFKDKSTNAIRDSEPLCISNDQLNCTKLKDTYHLAGKSDRKGETMETWLKLEEFKFKLKKCSDIKNDRILHSSTVLEINANNNKTSKILLSILENSTREESEKIKWDKV